jgi:cell volume regulation protein A
MLAGSEGLGGIHFDDSQLAQTLGVIALNFILFSGGLDTRMESIRPVIWRGVTLSTVGVLFTAAIVGISVHLITDFSLLEGLLLGSIVSSTDAAAVFSILRSRQIGLKGYIRPTLELESGSNDPMAYILTINLTFLLLHGDASWSILLLKFLQQMIIGGLMGYFLGRIMVIVLNNIKLDTEGLYPVLLMAFTFFTYSFTDFLGGTGFLAVYLSALVLGNRNFIHKKSLLKFYDGLAWLMQIIMFLTLGLLVYPSKIVPIVGIGILVSLILIFIARPVGVFISLAFFKVQRREKIFISWVGLRGAVPIVFATYPLLAKIDKADMIFHLVFFISVTSVLIQGSTLPLVARWLNVIVSARAKRKSVLDLELSDTIKSELMEIILPGNSTIVGKSIVQLEFPKSASIVLLKRNKKYIQPAGSTILEEGDMLVVLASNRETLKEIYHSLDIKENAILQIE